MLKGYVIDYFDKPITKTSIGIRNCYYFRSVFQNLCAIAIDAVIRTIVIFVYTTLITFCHYFAVFIYEIRIIAKFTDIEPFSAQL